MPKAGTPPLSLAMNLRFTINTDIPTRLGHHCGILTSEPCATTSQIDIPTRLGYHRDYSRPPPSAPSYPPYLPQNLRSDQWLPGRMRLHSLQLRIYIVSFRALNAARKQRVCWYRCNTANATYHDITLYIFAIVTLRSFVHSGNVRDIVLRTYGYNCLYLHLK